MSKDLFQYDPDSFFLNKKGTLVQYTYGSNDSKLHEIQTLNRTYDDTLSDFSGIIESSMYFVDWTSFNSDERGYTLNGYVSFKIQLKNSTGSQWNTYSLNLRKLFLYSNYYEDPGLYIPINLDGDQEKIKFYGKFFLIYGNFKS